MDRNFPEEEIQTSSNIKIKKRNKLNSINKCKHTNTCRYIEQSSGAQWGGQQGGGGVGRVKGVEGEMGKGEPLCSVDGDNLLMVSRLQCTGR